MIRLQRGLVLVDALGGVEFHAHACDRIARLAAADRDELHDGETAAGLRQLASYHHVHAIGGARQPRRIPR